MADEKKPEAKASTKLEGEGTALEIANARERDIQLKGRHDPDNFEMPDGRSLSETRKGLYETHLKESEAATKVQLERVREQSMASDPIYQEGASVVMHGTTAAILPAEPMKEQEPIGGDLKTSKDSSGASSKPAALPAENPRPTTGNNE